MRRSLEYAGKQGIPFVIVIGKDEIKAGKVKIRNMEDGTEKELDLNE